jgi:L-lysine exporter family protein LysE/ArgO
MMPLWSGFLLSLSLCLDLGIVNVAILRTALQRGGRAGFLVGLGSSVGDLLYFGLAAVGALAVLSIPAVRWIFWLGGTAVLLYLAWKMLLEVLRPHEIELGPEGGVPAGGGGLFGRGLSLALASPTAIVWFAAVGGSVIAAYGGQRRVLVPFAAGFFLAGVAWSVVLAFGAAALSRWGGRRLVRALSLVSALLFLYFAVTIFLRGLAAVRGGSAGLG